MGQETDKRAIKKIAVLFTDVVGSTGYFKKHGDLLGREMLQRHQDIASEPVVEFNGYPVKTLGDSVLAYFIDKKEALKCAITIQQRFKKYNEEKNREQIHVRIGIHYGEGIVEKQDIFGNVVNLAAKIVVLANGDEIYISNELKDKISELSQIGLERVKKTKKEKELNGIDIFKVIWKESRELEPDRNVLLYIRPLLKISGERFRKKWLGLTARKDTPWKNKVIKKKVLSDKSAAFILKNGGSGIETAEEILKYLKGKTGKGSDFKPPPVQMVIDSGPYLQADKLNLKQFKVEWEKIETGEIYISSSAYQILNMKISYKIDPPLDENRSKIFHKLLSDESPVQERGPFFLYRDELIKGDENPCYYCGARDHKTAVCPGKQITDTPGSIRKLGYLSSDEINKLFFNYLTSENREQAGENPLKKRNEKIPWVSEILFELKCIFHPVLFIKIWDSGDEEWIEIEKGTYSGKKGGTVWLALDCLRMSNPERANELLNKAKGENFRDYKVYCAMGFLKIEENDLRHAQELLQKAFDFAKTRPQKILVQFLLFRLYELLDESIKRDRAIDEILSLAPQCHEAKYLRVKQNFNKGLESKAVTGLVKLIEEQGNYFTHFMIDPELTPHGRVIESELQLIFSTSKERARNAISRGEAELGKLSEFLEKNEPEIKRIESLISEMKTNYKSNSYLGNIDVINHAESIVSLAKRSIRNRLRKLDENIHNINMDCKKNLEFIKKYPFKTLIGNMEEQIGIVQSEIDHTDGLIRSGTLHRFKEMSDHIKEITVKGDRINRKIEKLERIKQSLKFIYTFFQQNLIVQSINFMIGLIIFPLAIHYLAFLVPALKISGKALWSYQTGFLIMVGISGLLFSLIRTVNKLFPD